MNGKTNKIKDIVLPHKKINYFILGLIVFGIISGAIFFTVINKDDKTEVIKQINYFFTSINNNSFDSGLAFKNALYSNGILVITIWLLGMSVIGILFNIFIVYIKSFIVGFSISSIIGVYGLKGIIASFIYVFPAQIIDIICISVMGIYSMIFSLYVIRLITQKKGINNRNMIKKYMLIFIISLLGIVMASSFEAFFLPAFMKLVIGIYTI